MAPDPSGLLMLFGAHHDDNELNAGTIARHVRAGWKVVSVVMTDGRWVRGDVADAHVQMRNAESRAAARLLGIEPVFLGFTEGDLRPTPDMCRAVVRTMRAFRPDVVVTHPPKDYHNDHMATSACVREAVYRCGNAAYECPEDPCPGPKLYWNDAWVLPFEPDLYVDVSEFVELKRQALGCHRSQLGPGGPGPGDMIDIEISRARMRGFESGFAHAEAFRFVPRPGAVRTAGLLT